MPPLFLFITLLCLLLPPAYSMLGISCKQHPVYFPHLKPVLVQSWEFSPYEAYMSHYHPRYTKHRFAPVDNPSSTKYEGLDWFWATTGTGNTNKYATLYLQRPAKVYLLLQFETSTYKFPPATLPGWKPEGHATLVKGIDQKLTFGVHQHGERFVPMRGYVFSKRFEGEAYIPHQAWVKQNAKGVKARGDYVIMIAEEDGSASTAPKSPPGIKMIQPNARCPEALHDLWVTPDEDASDPDTVGKMWKTFHPRWDPCYFCAYDHEHGSSPLHLMGYAPKYDYTAWKNGREDESNEGFKGIVFKSGDYLVYYNVHVQTSSLRRVNEPNHTITLVIVDARTKERVVEINHKGDFGFLSTRAEPTGFFPLSLDDKNAMEEQRGNMMPPRRRTINVINTANLDNRFSYLPKDQLLLGRYEEWSTAPLCSRGGPYEGKISLDITDASTGIKSIAEKGVKILLGSYNDGQFIRSTGSKRLLQLNNFIIAEDACMFKLGNIHGERSASGVFYTDAYGKNLMSGPGPNNVRQFIKRGFRITLSGRYEAVDSWLGLHKNNHMGFMQNYGYGLDSDVN